MALKKNNAAISIAGMALALSFGLVSAASALSTSCVGVPTATNITWTASSAGGVAPVAFLWGNGSTSSTQTVAVTPGTYSMTIQATDASSSVATSTCATTVVQSVPSIASFVASPSSITAGQSTVLSWTVSNASSTSINNGVGTVSSTSITVTPTVTTTYQLSATNPGGTSTANATVTVNATTSTGTGSGITAQIQALLAQIAALKNQIMQLIQQQGGTTPPPTSGTGTSTPPIIGCLKFNKDLHFGDRGNDVKDLQSLILPPGLATGFFGKKTEDALNKLHIQLGTGSTSTSTFGPNIRSIFREHCNEKDTQWMSASSTFSVSVKHGDDEGGNRMAPPPMMGGNHGENGNHGNNGKGKGDN